MIAPSAFRSVARKARKAHKCCECGEVINIGDQYQYSSGIWDGEPDDFKQCLNCGVIFEAVTKADYEPYSDCGPCFGQLKNYLLDSDCNHADELLAFSQLIGVGADSIDRLLKVGLFS
jgi:hypothetical protein